VREESGDHVTVPLGHTQHRCNSATVFTGICAAWLLTLVPLHATAAQTGRVEGTVVNMQTGAPVLEARVIIEGTRFFALTDRQGHYAILDVPVGMHNIRVEAVGFEHRVHLNHRVLEHDRRALDVQPTRVDLELRPLRRSPEDRPVHTALPTAVQPGFGLGASVGMQGLGGSANRAVRPGASVDLFGRYGTPFGLMFHAGGRFGTFGIDSVPASVHVYDVFFESRFTLLNVSARWAPFITGQAALNRETARGNRVKFEASGYSLGGGGGAYVRLAPELTVETGLTVGLLAMDDFVSSGDWVTYQCLEGLEPGTPLPETIVRCGDLITGSPEYTCYPPFSDRYSGECDAPKIERVGSERSGLRYRLWVGFQLSLWRP